MQPLSSVLLKNSDTVANHIIRCRRRAQAKEDLKLQHSGNPNLKATIESIEVEFLIVVFIFPYSPDIFILGCILKPRIQPIKAPVLNLRPERSGFSVQPRRIVGIGWGMACGAFGQLRAAVASGGLGLGV